MHATAPAGQAAAAVLQPGQVGGATRGELAQPNTPVRSDVVAAGAARPDAPAAAPRSDAAFMDRMAVLQRAALAPSALPANAAANTAAPTALAATAAGATMATSATPQALPVNQAADARNAAGLTVADRGQAIRSDAMTGTYTGEGPLRRRLRRGASALPGSLSTLLAAMGAQGRTSGAGQDARAMERELQAAAMQWLFWLLAIIAYGCVAFAVIGLMPPGAGTVVSAGAGRGWAGGFAIAGLLAASGAWWFARRLAPGRGKAPPATPRGD
ncbi:hypothetical protein [Luteimonas sp. MC1572]|nr:hypothetical protein [Luteimonas sp. MC1572]MBJ6981799.1 hypothetical protein [Luteimonas sp. MC1572]QQO03082.1 hypothetical protein JGR64_13155 [Luteimonas sp. MC1572]